MRSPDVVILGGGVMGASAAWHLASRGCRDVLVLDRFPAPGQGSTGRATGGFRSQFSTEVNVRLSLLSREKLLRFPEEVGADSGYHPYGYLFLAGDEEQLAALDWLLGFLQPLGVPGVERLGPEDIRRINPAVNTDGIPGGTLGTTDGFIRPLEILRGYTEAARRLGVGFEYGAEVTGLTMEGDRIVRVETSRGPVSSRFVINAAGAWAGAVARMAGIEIPVEPARRQVAATRPFSGLPETMPMTIFLEDGFHLRVRDDRVLLLRSADLPSADPFDTTFDPSWLPGVVERAHYRVPCLREAGIDLPACWAGLYEMSPDSHVIVGPAPGLANLFLMNGSSGHGVMHSPALGQIVAEMILDGRASSVDVHALRPSRFAEGEPNRGLSLL
ncbi:MAG TPA: FAD-binding oxidoreductase [Thermoanaerobaculia bacterium]|nr:FAD-binding oxidoreductase [Thermoanaerobaculia bacterium]